MSKYRNYTPVVYVYVIRAVDTPYYKIGTSKNVEHRATEIMAKAPRKVRAFTDQCQVVDSVAFPDRWRAERAENDLHTEFDHYQVERSDCHESVEWFLLTDIRLELVRYMLRILVNTPLKKARAKSYIELFDGMKVEKEQGMNVHQIADNYKNLRTPTGKKITPSRVCHILSVGNRKLKRLQ